MTIFANHPYRGQSVEKCFEVVGACVTHLQTAKNKITY